MKSLKDTYKLSNGVGIPCVGFGTFQTPEGKLAVDSVRVALLSGYRHIDTAAVYGNEQSVGEGIRESGIPREDIFVTTKLWNSDQGYESTKRAFYKSIKNLGLEYIDLYLIHWPRVKGRVDQWPELNRESWRAMEELYAEGVIKAIGVSNFKTHHIESLIQTAEVMPMINQIELHPGWLQQPVVDYCKQKGIVVEAWGPFSRGNLFKSGLLVDIAEKYEKTVAQVCLRWHLQREYLPLPKSVTPERIEENTRIFDFELSDEDMQVITSISRDTGTGRDSDMIAY